MECHAPPEYEGSKTTGKTWKEDKLLYLIAAELPSPGIITLFGMGTVFICLIIILIIMVLMTRILSSAREEPDARGHVIDTAGEKSGDRGVPGYDKKGGTTPPEVVAAITLALSKHRAARKIHVKTSSPKAGVDPWRFSGRMRGLRR